MKGRFNVEVRASLPTFDSNRDVGRFVYSEQDEYVYYGTSVGWEQFTSGTELQSHIDTDVPNAHGMGTIASQDYSNVSITGGNVVNISNMSTNDISISSPNDVYNDLSHDAFSNYVSNEHINHSNVTVTGGSGLSGGGDLTSSRSISLDAHDNTFHSEIYATETWVSNNFNDYSLETHDNTYHSSSYYSSGDDANLNSLDVTNNTTVGGNLNVFGEIDETV